MGMVRAPAVAGTFYPSDPRQLEAVILSYLAATSVEGPVPKAVVAPHAGYVYSGPIAASAYARLLPARGRVRRVVLIGPSHRVPFRGLAVTEAEAYQTPLGRVPIDREAVALLMALPEVGVLDAAHGPEHSLEVHVPFLQTVLGDFALVPIVAGAASAEAVARALEAVWGGEDTAIVVSSDLSHYLDYDSARAVDGRTAAAIEALSGDEIGDDQACGRVPLRGLLALAKRRAMTVQRLDLRNSGDTAGPRDGVVGYGAWAFFEPAAKARDEDEDTAAVEIRRHARTLIELAQASIRMGLASGRPLPVDLSSLPEALRAPGAAFVTLKNGGHLRGCIGSPSAYRPLAQDVAENAFAAAFRDPRFAPLTEAELAGLDLSVAVLTPPEPMTIAGEDDLLRQLRPRTDGLIIESHGRRALFLPAVWESLPEPAAFLAQLKHKAGLPPGAPAPHLRAWRFQAVELAPE